MNKKLLSSLVASLVLSAMTSAPAQAFSITSGNYKMEISGYINGSVYGMAAGATCGGIEANAGNILACDNASHVTPTGEPIGSSVDSWGILSIGSIQNLSTGNYMFTRGVDGYLIGYVDGITDFYSQDSGASQKDYSTGGRVDIYKSSVDYNPSIDSNSKASVLASVSVLPLWLGMHFVAGAGQEDPLVSGSAAGLSASYISTFDPTTYGTKGDGFLEVDSGTAKSNFEIYKYTTFAGNQANAKFSTTITALDLLDPTNEYPANAQGNYLAAATSDVFGRSVPEPGSMALVGLGLMGLAGLRRRKVQA